MSEWVLWRKQRGSQLCEAYWSIKETLSGKGTFEQKPEKSEGMDLTGRVPEMEWSEVIILWIIALNVLILGRHVSNDDGLTGNKAHTKRDTFPDRCPLESRPSGSLCRFHWNSGQLPFPDNTRLSHRWHTYVLPCVLQKNHSFRALKFAFIVT